MNRTNLLAKRPKPKELGEFEHDGEHYGLYGWVEVDVGNPGEQALCRARIHSITQADGTIVSGDEYERLRWEKACRQLIEEAELDAMDVYLTEQDLLARRVAEEL